LCEVGGLVGAEEEREERRRERRGGERRGVGLF